MAPSQGPGEGGLNPKELGVRVPRLDISGLDIADLIPGAWLTFHRTSGFDLVARVPGPKPKRGTRRETRTNPKPRVRATRHGASNRNLFPVPVERSLLKVRVRDAKPQGSGTRVTLHSGQVLGGRDLGTATLHLDPDPKDLHSGNGSATRS